MFYCEHDNIVRCYLLVHSYSIFANILQELLLGIISYLNVSGNSNEPLEPSIVGTLGKVKLILSKEPLSLAIACSGKIYSILAIAPIIALILFKLSGLKTSEPNVLVTSPAKLFGFSPTGPVGKPLASFMYL